MVRRKIIHIDEDLCNGCGECIVNCAEAALEIINGKAKVVADKFCDGLGACMGHCPTGALSMIEREADPFDEDAVHERVKMLEKQEAALQTPVSAAGCPSAGPMSFGGCPGKQAMVQNEAGAVLPNWPVKLRLIPENADFLKDSHLLLGADCVPAAISGLAPHLKTKPSVALACPKFEDYFQLTAKLSRMIGSNNIKEISVMEMEVPCCSPLHQMALQAVEMSGQDLAVNRVVVSRQGRIISRETFTGARAEKAVQPA
ncbi:ATP-binding protein [Desulfonatronovibrio hydrogenovorans]|uniref:ATP-binding protein n=1 Tax=Desulfonatronovibrio hydrogenovorans TaxID=53245 RepID=UPI000551666E|nr:4Fe-4S dicluster domain-containing protein [Desulfonatronovibrio hydrogenovorans]